MRPARTYESGGPLALWAQGADPAELDTTGWTTHHWLHFLRNQPEDLTRERMAELDKAFDFTNTGNSEVLEIWLQLTIAHGYEPADRALERFLTGQGRMKFLIPLYKALAETPQGLERARQIYAQARPRYHPLAAQAVDSILGWKDGGVRPARSAS